MSGAVAMSGMAAARAGAGLVRLAVPDCCVETVAGYSPCSMIIPLARQDSCGRICGLSDLLLEWVKLSDCIAIGPGLGRSPMLDQTVLDLLTWINEHSPQSAVVIDADGLNSLASSADWTARLPKLVVLTPHPGEWSRLSGVPASQAAEQAASAEQLVQSTRCTIVLKGHRTLVAGCDATGNLKAIRNETGTPAMATGGSGDVLTGVITALICQGLAPFEAAWLAVHVHGLAGQLAQAEMDSHVVLPTDLIQFLPRAFSHVHQS